MTRSKQLQSVVAAGLLLFAASGAFASIMSGSAPGSDGLSPPSAGAPDPEMVFAIDLLGNDATAILSASALGNGAFWASSGTLDVTAGPDTGTYSLSPGGPGPFTSPSTAFSADNALYPGTDPYLDEYGLLFAGDGLEINIFGDSPGVYSLFSCTGPGSCNLEATGTPTSVSLQEVPEPGTLALFGIGAAALAAGLIVRRRKLS